MNDMFGVWVAIGGALALGSIALALAIQQARKGSVAVIRGMAQKISDQRALIAALQRQAAEQWARIADQEQQLLALHKERENLERRLAEAESKTQQMQAIVDQLLPGVGNDRSLIVALRETLASGAQRLAQAQAENVALKQLAGGLRGGG